MEQTSIEQFQTPHNKYTSARSATTQPHDFPIHSIEHDDEDLGSLSGSAHHSSGPDEAVFDGPFSRRSSPHTSPHHSDDNGSISSSFFSGSQDPSCPPDQPSSPYTPLKMRSPFRNPSSVRAMQLETTPPPYIPSSQSRHRSVFPTPSRNGTPKSVRSCHSGMRMTPSKLSPTKRANVKKEYPLVLLHVTLLPIPKIYSAMVMDQVLPSYLLENWKILHEKATDTVLERGILIPHPKEDYDLLEERLLESLDLRTPRILKCGHFHADPDEEADIAGSDSEVEEGDEDADICDDCGRRVRDGRYGSGSGSRRWDIKVFAANGLMRAGAWGAAWREMERVDIEIIPWMEDEVKRELALRTEEERKHTALVQEESLRQSEQRPNMDEDRLREIYGNDLPSFPDSEPKQTPRSQPDQAVHQRQDEIPLQELLKDYLVAASQDRKNIAIFVLTLYVLYLSMAWNPTSVQDISHGPTMASVGPSVSTVAAASSTSIDPASVIESITSESSKSPIVSTVTQENVEGMASPAPAPAPSLGDSMDSIEAQFDFADE
ncbi:MAG: hypothetical protein Q9198_005417 [Flavoplaca austrocitrina]